MRINPINWNRIEEPIDLEVWNKLTANFWLPEKIALSNDIKSWDSMTENEQEAVNKIFGGLTMLDTVQAVVGAPTMIPDARTQHEEAVLTYISFNESVHAKSYSSIFQTLNSSEKIDQIFRWARENEYLQKKEDIVLSYYHGNDPLKKKIASILLESFLFYSGFYLPLWWSARGKLTNTADIVKMILADEALHSYYLGFKFQLGYKEQPKERQNELKEFTFNLLLDLYDNEEAYTEDMYDEVGLTEDVKKFLKYNANKALMNLGFDPLFPRDEAMASIAVMSALSPQANENHDFFSGSGSSYIIGKVEETDDDDWSFD